MAAKALTERGKLLPLGPLTGVQADINAKIQRLADRQSGVVARFQLLALGLSENAIDRRLAGHHLVRLYAGVYAVGHRILTPRGHFLAAVLAYGPTAVLSHKSAGRMWGLLNTDQRRVDVTVPGTSRKHQKGIRVHRARRLHPDDITTLGGIPITSVARTILDLAVILRPQAELEVIEHADRAGLLDFAALQRGLERRPRQSGSRHLRRIIADYTTAPDTRSALERRFLRLIRKAGLPEPRLNARLGAYIVDVYWPQWHLVVELDSRAFHLGPRPFENDRVRDAKLQRLGIRSLRITDKRMKTAPRDVIDDILALAALAA